MALIGTHDSVTGEKGYGFFGLFRWFGQTQVLTIKEQAICGVKYFDLRVRKTDRGWICAHGLWETKKTFTEILSDISKNTPLESVLLAVTYEGTLPKEMTEESFIKFIKKTVKKYSNLSLHVISEKYKKIKFGKKVWNTMWSRDSYGYKIIGHYPHFSLTPFPPIPSLWKMEKPIFSEDSKTITIIDFLTYEDFKD